MHQLSKPMRKLAAIFAIAALGYACMGASKIKNTPFMWKVGRGWVLNGGSPYTKGMIALYLLDEGAGPNYNSTVNNAQTRLVPTSGNPAWGNAQFGIGISSGSSGGLRAPNISGSPFNDLPLNTNGFTLLMWIKNPGNNVIFRKTAAGTNNAPGWIFQNNGAGQWIFRIQTSGAQCNGTTNAVFPTTVNFYQVVWRFNGGSAITAANYSIFLNGIPVTFSSTTNGTGVYNTDASNPFDNVITANMDHMVVWNRALSNGEIRDLAVEPFAFMAADPNAGLEAVTSGATNRAWSQIF